MVVNIKKVLELEFVFYGEVFGFIFVKNWWLMIRGRFCFKINLCNN